MDLLQLIDGADDHRAKALGRLDGIIALYRSADAAVREEAMGRAMMFCSKEWGGYGQGLFALADQLEAENRLDEALMVRLEAEDPGAIIRQTEADLAEAAMIGDERQAIIARYGSEEDARGPTALECLFIDATRDRQEDVDDPWSPLSGWSVPWHPIPDELAHDVAIACPMPESIGDAQAEALAWDQRLAELEILGEGPGSAVLPTACAVRHQLVRQAWARELEVTSLADFQMRLRYWQSHGQDGAGYDVLAADLARLLAQGTQVVAKEDTKAKCRRLHLQHPDWPLARIGKELRISRQAVHKHLQA